MRCLNKKTRRLCPRGSAREDADGLDGVLVYVPGVYWSGNRGYVQRH
jgi:hypothetical protein